MLRRLSSCIYSVLVQEITALTAGILIHPHWSGFVKLAWNRKKINKKIKVGRCFTCLDNYVRKSINTSPSSNNQVIYIWWQPVRRKDKENCKLNFWIESVSSPTTKHRSSWAIAAILIPRLLLLERSLIRCAISRLQLASRNCKIDIPRFSRCIQNVLQPLIDYLMMPRQLNILPDILGNVLTTFSFRPGHMGPTHHGSRWSHIINLCL